MFDSGLCLTWLIKKLACFWDLVKFIGTNRRTTALLPTFFAYDAGRQVLIDRAGEVNLLEESDLNQKGINKVCQILSVSHTIVMNGLFVLGVCQIFFRRFCSEDTVNLDWKVVKAFYQIVPRLPQTPGY